MPSLNPEAGTEMATLGIIGSGNIGAAVARLAVAAGFPSRQPKPVTSSCCGCH
jgi:phosphoglycerate dehydrogenase-like enzyme